VDQSVGPFEHKILTGDAKWMRKPAGMSGRQDGRELNQMETLAQKMQKRRLWWNSDT